MDQKEHMDKNNWNKSKVNRIYINFNSKKMARMVYLTLLLMSNFFTFGSCQFLQPRKLFQTIRDLHDSSNKLVSVDDSMSLYVDISEASKYPPRDDLRLRVYNKDRNVTVCDHKMADYEHTGKFPCMFRANQADLHHGANQFEFEVYSDLSGKRFASQKIPDIHLFDHYLYEGYYDAFYNPLEIRSYTVKTLISSIIAILLAHVIDAGPVTAKGELHRVFTNVVKAPVVALSVAVIDLQRQSSLAFSRFCLILLGTSVKLIFAVAAGLNYHFNAVLHFTGLKNIINIRTAADFALLAKNAGEHIRSHFPPLAFLFEIFHAGLSSPFHLLGKFLEEGLLYFILLFSTIQKKMMFQYSASTTAGGPTLPPKKKTQIVSLQKRHSLPVVSMQSSKAESKSKIAGKLTLETIILSRAIPVREPAKIVAYSAATTDNIAAVPIKKEGSRSRGIIKNVLRTAGLCFALLLLAPGSTMPFNIFRLEGITALSRRIQGSDAAFFVSTKIYRLKLYLLGFYSRVLNRPDPISVSVAPAIADDGSINFKGRSKSCPFLNKSRSSTYAV